MSAPRLPVGSAEAAAVAAAEPTRHAERQVAGRVSIDSARGRLNAAEREALLRRLAARDGGALLRRQLLALSAFGDADLLAGNTASLLIDGPATFDALFRAIDAARHSVLVESYIVEDTAIGQQLADRLIRKRAQGVQVALIYDAIGSVGTDAAYFDALRAGGVLVCAFNPIVSTRARDAQSPTQRDHRKIVAVDRRVAFSGGINISGSYASGSFGRTRHGSAAGWRDTHLQVQGPAAERLDALVRDTWRRQRCDGAIDVPPAPAPSQPAGKAVVRIVDTRPDDDHSRIYAQLMTAFDVAQRSIWVTMAYFAPGDDMIDALVDAAHRGVDVQLILPSVSDFQPVLHAGRARYQTLLQAGVRIHEFKASVLHAKTVVVDGVWSTVGSSNLDYRSFVGNNEVNTIVLGEDFGDAMQRMFQQDLAVSTPITLQAWQERPLGDRLLQSAARLLERWW